MSHRITAFKSLMYAPNLANRYVVTFNVLSAFSMRIYETSIPTHKAKYATYYENGDEVKIPVRYDNSGDWSFTVYEDDLASFSKILKVMWNLTEPISLLGTSKEGDVTGTGRFTRIVRNTESVTPYSAELILLDSATGSIPVRAVQLRDVTIESVSDIQLRANSNDPLGVEVKCHYNDLKDVF